MKRREFLKIASCIPPYLALSPTLKLWAAPRESTSLHAWNRSLILIELKGGNDGLNTVVPFKNDRYYALRPKLAIPQTDLLSISDTLGFHPACKALMNSWEGNELAVLQGVGYPKPNRSHFRSIDIWETGSDSDEFLQQGWLSRIFNEQRPPADLPTDGIIIGDYSLGPLNGRNTRTMVIRSPKKFFKQAMQLKELSKGTANNALAHIVNVQNELRKSAEIMREKIKASPKLKTDFPKTKLGRQLEMTAKILISGISVPVIKITHGGFDTHTNQKNVHSRLLKELSEGCAALQKALQEAGLWNNTLVMTYSEFGRRVAENGSQGTDHGTAAAHLMLGGKVKGGIYGTYPDLENLDQGDLNYTMDFRRLYATVGQKWWNIPLKGDKTFQFSPIGCLG